MLKSVALCVFGVHLFIVFICVFPCQVYCVFCLYL